MKATARLAVITAATCMLILSGFPAISQDLAKPKFMPPAKEKLWVDAVLQHKTTDGATVLQVLQFVWHVRPRQFSYGSIGVGYNGATGLPETVGISYWLGAKRLPGDAYVNLSYDVEQTGDVLSVKPTSWPFSQALELGRDAFLQAVDGEYHSECIDPETQRKLC